MSNIEFTNRNKNGVEMKDGVLKTTYLTEYKSIDVYRKFIDDLVLRRIENVKKEMEYYKGPECRTNPKSKIFADGYVAACKFLIYHLQDIKCFTAFIPEQVLSDAYGREFHFVRKYDFEIKQQYAWRNQCLIRDGCCKKCGCKSNLVVHHIVPYKLDVTLRWNVNNGITLCEDCHKQFNKEYGVAANVEELFEFIWGNIVTHR
jgi:hypothetical protein